MMTTTTLLMNDPRTTKLENPWWPAKRERQNEGAAVRINQRRPVWMTAFGHAHCRSHHHWMVYAGYWYGCQKNGRLFGRFCIQENRAENLFEWSVQ